MAIAYLAKTLAFSLNCRINNAFYQPACVSFLCTAKGIPPAKGEIAQTLLWYTHQNDDTQRPRRWLNIQILVNAGLISCNIRSTAQHIGQDQQLAAFLVITLREQAKFCKTGEWGRVWPSLLCLLFDDFQAMFVDFNICLPLPILLLQNPTSWGTFITQTWGCLWSNSCWTWCNAPSQVRGTMADFNSKREKMNEGRDSHDESMQVARKCKT